jgi:hypothetical protein
MSRGTAAAGVLLVSLAATAAHAQSLAEAAAKAEEERKASGKASRVYTDETLLRRDGFESLVSDRYLLQDHYTPYLYARVEITYARAYDRSLDKWLLEKESTGGRYELETAVRSTPKLMAILDKWHISARDYFMADAAFELAGNDLQTSWTQEIVLTESRKANVDFIRSENNYPPYYAKAPWGPAENSLHNARVFKR